jgi:hypothetical protein
LFHLYFFLFNIDKGESGGPYVSGWILTLFPYISDCEENKFVWSNKSWQKSNGLTTNCFKYLMNQVPFLWQYYSTKFNMNFISGLVGVTYAKVTVFGYAIAEVKRVENLYESD